MADRKFRILQAIIDDYILTALPVGSRTISRKYEQKLSSATIRNEMSDLEELGYLDSPHTSAGRVPSYKGYRLYVDRLMQRAPLSKEEAEAIQSYFDRRVGQLEDATTGIAAALSGVTQYTSIVVTGQEGDSPQRLAHLQLIPVTKGVVLLLLVTDTGIVKQVPMHMAQELSSDDLYQVSKMLSIRLQGIPMDSISETIEALAREFTDQQDVLYGMLEAAKGARTKKKIPNIAVGGRSNILNFPEYNDVDKAKALLSVLETKDKLWGLISQGGGMEFSVRIGPEIGMPETQDCSLVTASYRMGDGRVNTIGVIGPTRMQYSKVISVLDFMGKTLSQLLSEQDEK